MKTQHFLLGSLTGFIMFFLLTFTCSSLFSQTQVYYNGTNFYLEEDCSGSPIQNSSDVNITTIQDLIDSDDSESLVINIKALYTVDSDQTIDGGSGYVMIKRWTSSTGFDASDGTTFYNSTLVIVSSGASLTLKNVVVDGASVWSGTENTTLGRGTINVGVIVSVSMINVFGTLNVEGGAILQNAYNDNSNIGGGAISIGNSGIFNMSSGIVQNCCAVRGGAIYNRGTAVINGDAEVRYNGGTTLHGGAVYNASKTITLSGNAKVRNNVVTQTGGAFISAGTGKVIIEGGSIIDNRCSGESAIGGAGICTGTGGSYVIITGGLISGNVSDNCGGGIYLRIAYFQVTGGSIIGNTASSSGNNVYIFNNNTQQIINGGTLEDVVGLSPCNTANDAVFVDTVTLPNISQRTKVDSVYVADGSTAYTYGCKDLLTDGSGNLYLWLPSNCSVGKVFADKYEYYYSNGELTSVSVISNGGTLYNTIDSDSIAKVFGGSQYVAITGSNESGWTIALDADIVLKNVINVISGQFTIIANDATRTILKNNSDRIFSVNGVLNLGSSTSTDSLIIDGNKRNSSLSNIDNYGTINIYDKTKIVNNFLSSNGNIVVRAKATVNMYGGEVSNNKAANASTFLVMSGGTLNMSDGIISNNISTSAGTIRTLALGKVNLSGGKIVNNVVGTNGGAIDNLGSVYLNGVEITGNVCGSDGGAIYSGNDSIILSGKVVVKDNLKICTIAESKDTSSNNIQINSNYNIFISSALSTGSSVYVNAAVTNDEDDLVIAEAVGSYVISGTDKSYFRHDVSTYNEVFVLKDDKIVLSPSTLPIDLYQFSGVCSEDGIKLSWTTASELNNDFFVLERSIDGVTFEKAGIIDGSGTTNSMEEYTFTDIMSDGGSYYHLLQVDFDGSVTTHEVIYVACGQDLRELQLSIYPNPVETTMFVSIEYASENTSGEDVEVDIYNELGVRVYNQVVSIGNSINVVNVNLEDLPYGVYNVVARTNKDVQSRMMIKR